MLTIYSQLFKLLAPEIREPIDFSIILSNNHSTLTFFTGRGNHEGHIARGRGARGREVRGRFI